MKIFITAIPILFICVLSQAQVIYYDSLWKEIPSKTDAHYYREVNRLNDTFYVKDFYISGQLQMKGSYLDSSCSIKHGLFTYYYSNGHKSSQGVYNNGTDLNKWDYWNEDGSEFVETMPEFTGGLDAMISFLQKEIKYPKDARRKNIEGRVIVQFVVGTEGEISQIEIVKSVYPSLDAEAIRVVSKMPKWKPGTQNGKPVFVKFTLPISFKLN
jgi:protein TonB